jgi:hypothetical protein
LRRRAFFLPWSIARRRDAIDVFTEGAEGGRSINRFLLLCKNDNVSNSGIAVFDSRTAQDLSILFLFSLRFKRSTRFLCIFSSIF